MYAVISTGGKQYRVSPGDVIRVDKVEKEPGEELAFDALMVSSDDGTRVGTPVVDGAKVKGTVKREGKHPKIWSFKKWEGHWAKIRGHRQLFTEIEITGIEG